MDDQQKPRQTEAEKVVGGIGQTAASKATNVATKKIGQQITKGLVGKGVSTVGKAATSAVAGAATGGILTAAQAAKWAYNKRRALAKWGGAIIAALIIIPQLIATSFAAITVIGLLALLVVFALVIFIINTGGYIVPASSSVYFPGGGQIVERVGCFTFDSTWEAVPDRQIRVTAAAAAILARPGANERICSGGDLIVTYVSNLAEPANVYNYPTIQIGPDGSSTPQGAHYTLAHESGHIVNYRNPDDFQDDWEASLAVTEGKLPSYFSYRYGCGTIAQQANTPIPEDQAETIGVYLYLPNKLTCNPEWQSIFPRHANFANRFFQ